MNAIKTIAARACKSGATAIFVLVSVAGCSGLPEPAVPPVAYSTGAVSWPARAFGPASLPATAPAKALPALALATLDNAGQPDGSTAVHYRLAYADARELRPYQQARWS